ncbi:MAG: peptide chain release factor N(5)-glutamine methyltransferase [Flavobacteriaceae bacterium]
MTIKQLQRIFTSELSILYPQTEIDAFFYNLCDAYLNLKRVDIALNPDELVNDERFHSALNDLVAQKPIQYIIGKTEFYGLEFSVNENVLIPRPETEELVNWIIEDSTKKESFNILDIGTGSGCIAIALAKNLSSAKISALDISKKALEIAKKNALNNNVAITFIEDDILTVKTKKSSFKYDVIVSNPPYVRELEKEQMQNNVLDNEPHLALFVSDDNPLLFYDAIANFAKLNLTKNGVLYFEINQYLGDKTVELLTNKGLKNIELKKDIFGVDRMLKAEL